MARCEEKRGDTVTWDVFLPDIEPYARGVPAELAMHRAREATIEFAKYTLALTRLYYADLYATVEDYSFEPTDGYTPVVVKRVLAEGRPLDVLTDLPVRGDRGAFYAPPGTIYIAPPPSKDVVDGLEIEVALTPSRDSCELDAFFFEMFGEGIAAKAVHDLLLMRGTDWYSPADAPKWYRRYRTAMTWGRVRSRRGFQSGPVIARTRRRWY